VQHPNGRYGDVQAPFMQTPAVQGLDPLHPWQVSIGPDPTQWKLRHWALPVQIWALLSRHWPLPQWPVTQSASAVQLSSTHLSGQTPPQSMPTSSMSWVPLEQLMQAWFAVSQRG
jgi:hypothetical protein